jgi:hypothetical protein
MDDPLQLPLPSHELPSAIQKFCSPETPSAARLMAARGVVPVRGTDMVILFVQLASATEADVAQAATHSVSQLPPTILLPACAQVELVAVLDWLARHFARDPAVLEAIATNAAAHDFTLEWIASVAPESLTERIAINEARLLRAPRIIEALYRNRATRMSTADRLIELAARHQLQLHNIPAYEAHVQALQGQLISEPSDQPLPEDESFKAALAADDDEDAIDTDPVDGKENLKPKFKPLAMQIADMTTAQKIRLAMVGSSAARGILVRDNNRQVAHAAIASPMNTEVDALACAKSKEVSQDILRYIARKKDWLGKYDIKKALVFNPKTPLGVALTFVSHLIMADLKSLSRSKNVPAGIKNAARQQIAKREKKES